MAVNLLTGISQASINCSCDGGISRSAFTSCDCIEDITYDSEGCPSMLVMADLDLWTEFIYDDDDSAFFNQTGERPTDFQFNANQETFIKFSGLTKEKVAEANVLKDICCGVAAHEHLNNCLTSFQGIEPRDASCNNSSTFKFTKKRLKFTPSALTDTGANCDRLEITLNSTGTCLSVPQSGITVDDLLAM